MPFPADATDPAVGVESWGGVDRVVDRGAGVLPPVGFGTHSCVFVDGASGPDNVIEEFVAEGLRRGEQVVYFHGPPPLQVDLARLTGAVDASTAVSTGQVVLRPAVETFAAGRPFDPRRVVDVMLESVVDAEREGRAAPRILSDMAWLLGAPPGPGGLAELERRTGRILAARGASVLCRYDVRCFTPEVLDVVVAAHSLPTGLDRSVTDLAFRVTAPTIGVLHLAGELDVAAYDVFEAALATASAGRDRLRLDLGELEFIDAGGVGCLLRGADHCDLELERPPTAVRRVLDILAVGDHPAIDVISAPG
jgi:anti-anti-sigma factor